MKRKTTAIAVSAAAATAAAATLGAAFGIYRVGFYHKPEAMPPLAEDKKCAPYLSAMERDAAELAAAPYETVCITADDGTPLAARYYHHADGAPVAIIFHGYKGFAGRDGMGGYQICRKLGYNVLLPDQRSHGESGGHTITMGSKEQYDCRAWAYWAHQHFGADTPLFLMGVSMGAATVLLAAGLDLPDTVCGVIADCGYTSAHAITSRCVPAYLPHVPVKLGYALGWIGARVFGHFDPEEADCRKALAKTKLPVLFIHGDADDFVPCEMSRENYAACAGEKQLLMIHGAAHAISYYVDTPAYTEAVTQFLHKTTPHNSRRMA